MNLKLKGCFFFKPCCLVDEVAFVQLKFLLKVDFWILYDEICMILYIGPESYQ